MKKILSSLIILTMIVSSFSAITFADAVVENEKTWFVPFTDFSTNPNALTGKNMGISSTYTGNAGWLTGGTDVYDSEKQIMNIHNNKDQVFGYSKGTAHVRNAQSSNEYFVFKALMKPANYKKERVQLVFPSGNNVTNIALMEITNNVDQGIVIGAPDTDRTNTYTTKTLTVDDYYGDGWLDAVVVMNLNSTEKTAEYPVDIYANGEKISSTFSKDVADHISFKGVIGVAFRATSSTAGNAIDDLGAYFVQQANKPALTMELNGLTFTTSNEVPLALLKKYETNSVIKVNGQYLPLEAITAKKGALSFEIDEDYMSEGVNTIDVSEVKDILGTTATGTTTFTYGTAPEVPEDVTVANGNIISYDDLKGLNTVTTRFFALINSLDFAKIGFEITAIVDNETEYAWNIELDEVYGQVSVNDVNYVTEGRYIVTAAIGDVPNDFEATGFEVKPYTVSYEGVKSYVVE